MMKTGLDPNPPDRPWCIMPCHILPGRLYDALAALLALTAVVALAALILPAAPQVLAAMPCSFIHKDNSARIERLPLICCEVSPWV